MPVRNGNEIRIEKLFSLPAPKVFQALAEGRLLNNCGGDSSSLEIDFKVGGGYRVNFLGHGVVCCGKYLEIIPNRKVVFTWGDEGSNGGFPKTQVAIDLISEGDQTRLVLTHTGFADQEVSESHDQGWNSGLEDLSSELVKGQVRIVRVYPVARQKLFAACSNPEHFFGLISDLSKGSVDFRVGGKYRLQCTKGEIYGEYKEIVPDQRIVFTWTSPGCGLPQESRVTLTFDDEEDGESSVELLHESLRSDEVVKTHRQGWELLTEKLRSVFH